MHGNGRHQSRIDAVIITLIAATFILAVLAGCMRSFGRFTLDAKVSQAFREGKILPYYRYYYAGRDTMPYAIIGIEADYAVPSRYWISFKPNADQLKKMSGNIYGKDQYYPYGAYIVDPYDNVIGVWYSSVGIRSVSVDPAHHTVQVLFKNPENEDDYM